MCFKKFERDKTVLFGNCFGLKKLVFFVFLVVLCVLALFQDIGPYDVYKFLK